MDNTDKKIAVIGTGLIGASWAAYFLAQGFNVVASDPAAGAEERLHELIDGIWPTLDSIGLAKGASRDRLAFHNEPGAAVQAAAFVQENGPERLDIKRRLIAQIDEATPTGTLIASSSSGILISDIQDATKHPERVLLGHPFNPPHLIPLVEVVGGRLTSPEAIQQAMDFYSSIGKKPVHIQREVKGHVANRLQAALWREAFYLVEQGVASVSDIDIALANGPGLRWALLGPFANLHLSGGPEGMAHTLEHLGPPMEEWWRDLGDVSLNPGLSKRLTEGVEKAVAETSHSELMAYRDALLLALLKLKRAAGGP